MTTESKRLVLKIRILLFFFVSCLLVSGLTAFPIETELQYLVPHFSPDTYIGGWLTLVQHAVADVNLTYPFLAYGTDWLAFAHIVIALAYIGPMIDPVRNRWVLVWGMICCLLIFPLAFIAGSIRGIPLFWQAIDCCFVIAGRASLRQLPAFFIQ